MRLAIVLLAVCLSACSSYTLTPLDYDSERVQLELRSIHEPKASKNRRPKVEKAWFAIAEQIDLSNGITLAEASSLALFYSPSVVTARAEKDIVGAQMIAAGLLPNPELFLGPRISTKNQSLIFPASLSFPIPLFGQRSASKAVAKAEFEEAEYEVMLTELSVLVEVASHSIKVAAGRKELRIREENIGNHDSLLRWINALFSSGSADSLTVFLARTERDKAFTALEKARTALGVTESELLSALGMLPGSSSIVVEPITFSQLALPINSPVVATANHPRILAAKVKYEVTEQGLRLELSKRFPNMRFGLEGESDDGDMSLGIGLGASIPIFDQNKSGITAARSRVLIAREEYRTTIVQLAHNQLLAQRQAEMNERLLQRLRERVSELGAANSALEMRLLSDDGNVLEALSSVSAINEARIEEAQLEAALLLARLQEAVSSGAAFSKADSMENPHE